MSQAATLELPLLVAVELKGRVTGLLGHLTLRQTFYNPHKVPLELTHIFPLPPRAAVVSCRLKTGKRYLPGQLMERRQARQSFQDRATQGKTACTLEQDRPDLYTLRIGPIAPGERLEVELTLLLTLAIEREQAVLSFPLTVGRRYVPGRPGHGTPAGMGTGVDTEIVADASRLNPPLLLPGDDEDSKFYLDLSIEPVVQVECHTHQLKLSRRQGILRIKNQSDQPARDLVLRLGMHPDSRLLVDPKDATFHFTPFWTENGSQQRPLVIVLDRSYAMRGQPLVNAIEIAHRLIDSLEPDQSFGLLSFAGTSLHFRSALVPAIPELKTAAHQYLQELTAQPGGELCQTLAAVEVLVAGNREPCDLVLLSSAELADHDRLVAWASRQESLRLHCVAVGSVVNSGLLDRLSDLTGGSFQRFEHPDRLNSTHQDLLETLTAARLSDLCLLGQPLLSASPEHWEVFSRRHGSYHGQFTKPPKESLEMIGTLADGSEYFEYVRPLESSHSAIGGSWARARLLDLEDRWAALPVGTVDLAVGGDKPASVTATHLRREAERGKAWLERVQDFWRRKGWLFPRSDNGEPALPLVKAMEETSCMAYGPSQLSNSAEILEEQARELLALESSIRELSLETGVLCRFTAYMATSGARVKGTAYRVVVPVLRVKA